MSKTYRGEKWFSALALILTWTLDSAMDKSRMDTVVEVLIELLSPELTPAEEQRRKYVSHLTALLRDPAVKLQQPVNIPAESYFSFLSCGVQMKHAVNFVGGRCNYQVTLSGAPSSRVPLVLSTVKFIFNNPQFNTIIRHGTGVTRPPIMHQIDGRSFKWTDVRKCVQVDDEAAGSGSWLSCTADLSLVEDVTLVLEGAIVAARPQELQVGCTGSKPPAQMLTSLRPSPQIQSVMVTFEGAGGWTANIPFNVKDRPIERTSRRKWIGRTVTNGVTALICRTLEGNGEQTTLRVNHRQPNFRLNVEHAPPGLLGEFYTLRLVVVNSERTDMRAYVDLELAPGEGMTAIADDTLVIPSGSASPTSATRELKNVDLGVIAHGSSTTLTVHVIGRNTPGERVLSIAVYFRLVNESSSVDVFARGTPGTQPSAARGFYSVIEETARIPFISPFEFDVDVSTITEDVELAHGHAPSVSDLGVYARGPKNHTSNEDPFMRETMQLVVASVKNMSPFQLELHREEMLTARATHGDGRVQLVSSSFDSQTGNVSMPGCVYRGDDIVSSSSALSSLAPRSDIQALLSTSGSRTACARTAFRSRVHVAVLEEVHG